MEINNWLKEFRFYWERKDVNGVLNLFSEDVVYYESPFEKIKFEDLGKEWKDILNQDSISVDFQVFSKSDGKYVIKWNLRYIENKKINHFSGLYLIELDEEGLCSYFYQVGEEDKKSL
jgi:hypothetical protein